MMWSRPGPAGVGKWVQDVARTREDNLKAPTDGEDEELQLLERDD